MMLKTYGLVNILSQSSYLLVIQCTNPLIFFFFPGRTTFLLILSICTNRLSIPEVRIFQQGDYVLCNIGDCALMYSIHICTFSYSQRYEVIIQKPTVQEKTLQRYIWFLPFPHFSQVITPYLKSNMLQWKSITMRIRKPKVFYL